MKFVWSLLISLCCFASRPAAGYTAEEYIAIFANKAPKEYAKNPERIARVALGAEKAELKLRLRFPQRALLGAILAATSLKESGLWESVHDGSRRGPSGEICLMQIHPVNTQWKAWAPSFESLAGTTVAATELCFLAGGQSLTSALNRCWARKYHKNWLEAMFTSYHYSAKCWLSPHAHERARFVRGIAATKWAATDEQRAILKTQVQAAEPWPAVVELRNPWAPAR